MSTSGEKVNVIIMRDNGEARRLRVSRSLLRWFIIFCCIMPCLAIIGIGCSMTLWQERSIMRQHIAILEHTNETYRMKSERLATLEALLQRDANTENTIIETTQENAKNTSQTNKKHEKEKKPTPQEKSKNQETLAHEAAQQEGPGHAEFPIVDTKQIAMGNVQVRLLSQNRLRTALDLRNLNSPESISGDIYCTLSLASGESIPLTLNPKNVGFFKIQHWKRAVLFATLQEAYDLTNAQVLIEVKTSDNVLIYRNIYNIEQ